MCITMSKSIEKNAEEWFQKFESMLEDIQLGVNVEKHANDSLDFMTELNKYIQHAKESGRSTEVFERLKNEYLYALKRLSEKIE